MTYKEERIYYLEWRKQAYKRLSESLKITVELLKQLHLNGLNEK